MKVFLRKWTGMAGLLTALLLGAGCAAFQAKDPLPEKNQSVNQLDPTPIERVEESAWWLNGEYIDEADKGFVWEIGREKRQKDAQKPKEEPSPLTANRTSEPPANSSEGIAPVLPAPSDGMISKLNEPARVAVVLDSRLAALDALRESIRRDTDWYPRVHIAKVKDGIDRAKAGELAQTISRRQWLRLVFVLTLKPAQEEIFLVMDGYSGNPLIISSWEDEIGAEEIITEMKKVLNRLQANLIWSSRVVHIRDMTAIVAYQAGVQPGDLLKIREKGEGILDPSTGLQLTWNPGQIVTSGKVEEILENGFLKVSLNSDIKGTAEGLLAVKP